MNVTIICPGGLKEPFLRDAQQEYVKRLSKCCSLQIVELPPKSIPKPGTPAQIDAALRDEGARILAAVRGGLTAALCVEGEQTDSEGFADIIRRARDSGGGRLNFIIGSSSGDSP